VVIVNQRALTKYVEIDLRTESVGIGTPDWQRQFYHALQPLETKTIKAKYVVGGPYLVRTIVTFGEFDRSPEMNRLLAVDPEEGWRPQPETRRFWRKTIPNTDPGGIAGF